MSHAEEQIKAIETLLEKQRSCEACGFTDIVELADAITEIINRKEVDK